MGQVLHGSATTTEAVRRAIQHSQASLRALAQRYGINPKTVAKWKKRSSVADVPTGPKDAKSTVLSLTEEAIIVAFRKHTPEVTGDKPAKKKFKAYPIGYLHIDIAEVHSEEGRLYLLVAIDRTSKFAFAQLHEKATRQVAGDFLRALIAAVPYTIHTVLTDNGTHFTSPGNTSSAAPLIKEAMARGEIFRAHSFELACAQNDIDHRLTKPRHPWTNGQVERMNRTIKDATVRRYYYDSHDQLRHHLQLFLDAYNHARRLKTLRGLTPYEYICKTWTEQPHRFITDPTHHTLGPNN
jgi:transposase InsO family protein